MLVAIEGVDGCGKTTLLKNLKRYYRNKGLKVANFREADTTRLATKVWDLIFNESQSNEVDLYLICAARVDFINRVLIPAQEENDLILMDRFFLSTIAYQGSHIGFDNTLYALKPLLGKVKIDHTLVLHGPTQGFIDRATDPNKFEIMGSDRMSTIQQYMLAEAKYSVDVHAIDATKGKLEILEEAVKLLGI